ncbi:hypothetical protein TGAM01_v205670 [Trichoderma gamsii]|uniref:Uncharacterized protein n=1 Tax=Trichoderma gamsii TaxID=398673 RepID=A0A2P4ZM56_9HYPO|nr:hypothetical protein TGAM01_v205670 [Trichoderma gamsii]PON25376.1 hypothetical protein TGAM01_v205670 [Trichoderma gamsii]
MKPASFCRSSLSSMVRNCGIGAAELWQAPVCSYISWIRPADNIENRSSTCKAFLFVFVCKLRYT